MIFQMIKQIFLTFKCFITICITSEDSFRVRESFNFRIQASTNSTVIWRSLIAFIAEKMLTWIGDQSYMYWVATYRAYLCFLLEALRVHLSVIIYTLIVANQGKISQSSQGGQRGYLFSYAIFFKLYEINNIQLSHTSKQKSKENFDKPLYLFLSLNISISLERINKSKDYTLSKMMMNGKAAIALQNQRFRTKLEASCQNYAYEILLLEIIVQDDHYHRKPTIDEISRLIQLYMLAVEVLESAADKRYDYFKRKIHSLMLKKHIVQQMHFATGKVPDQKTLKDCSKAQLQARKNQHEAQVYFNKMDTNKVQEILKKAQLHVNALNTNIRRNILSQEEQLQQRIKNRKMKSQSGSLSKFKIQSHNAQAKPEEKKVRPDPRMDYFDDYGQNSKSPKIGTTKNIRGICGSLEKMDIKKVRDFI